MGQADVLPIALRALLILGAVGILVYFIAQIRARRLQIDYAVFWVLFSVLLVFFAALPDVLVMVSHLLGFASAANLVFVLVIFLLILRLFSVNRRLSRSEQRIEDLTQRLALLEKRLAEQPQQAEHGDEKQVECCDTHGGERCDTHGGER
ncbi:MAG: DUF2304 domain-containing protein [Coriobacteriales bacterium]|jgi:hypothetical protein|nr:DUF2304 domain-containing protein [Coriobacteriales bacterium]